MPINPLRIDPTRTAMLRKKFEAELLRRFNRFRLELVKLLLDEDAFGLKEPPRVTANVFCPTGPGGGIDPTCSPRGGRRISEERHDRISRRLEAAHDKEVGKLGRRWSKEDRQIQRERDKDKEGRVLERSQAKELQQLDRLHEKQLSQVTAGIDKKLDSHQRKTDRDADWHRRHDELLRELDAASSPVQARQRAERQALLAQHRQAWKDYVLERNRKYAAEDARIAEQRRQELERLDVKLRRIEEKLARRLDDELTANIRWRFRSTPDKIREFKAWLRSQSQRLLLSDEELIRQYILEGFRRGAGRAFDDTRTRRFQPREGDFYRGSKEQFLRDSFAQPIAAEKLEILVSRTLDDLQGVTDAMATALQRSLADGLVQGKGPREIATELVKSVDGIGKKRASLIARSEIIRAHSEGMLTALEDLGIEELGVSVEWSVVKKRDGTFDARVCPLCRPLDGMVLTIDEARGMLPRHPACRCSWRPSGTMEQDENQKKSRTAIEKAIRQSVDREGGEKASKWVGADKAIAKKRPESILNISSELLAFSATLRGLGLHGAGDCGCD